MPHMTYTELVKAVRDQTTVMINGKAHRLNYATAGGPISSPEGIVVAYPLDAEREYDSTEVFATYEQYESRNSKP